MQIESAPGGSAGKTAGSGPSGAGGQAAAVWQPLHSWDKSPGKESHPVARTRAKQKDSSRAFLIYTVR